MKLIHTDNCGRTGKSAFGCKLDCGCWCHKGCRLDVELPDGGWRTLKAFDNYSQAASLVNDLTNAGISAMASCACGAYAYGECEACAIPEAESDDAVRELGIEGNGVL